MNKELYLQVETLQNLLTDISTGGIADNNDYNNLRNDLLNSEVKELLPDFIKSNRTTSQFWQFIKFSYAHYAERRLFIWDSFAPVFDYLENKSASPAEESITNRLILFNQEYIKSEWKKALDRKTKDPEGAITSARTLLETTCKHILDEIGIEYDDDLDLPKLYKLTAENLNLAPDQHTEQIFKQILSGCYSIVVGLGSLRNKLSDAHGKSSKQYKPSERHAELAVNLAGTMTTFLLETYNKVIGD